MNLWHDVAWLVPYRTEFSIALAHGLSWLGYATFIMFFMALGYWTQDKRVFYRLLVLVTANALINAYAKDFFQDPRPPLELRLDDRVAESFGLPSGHAQLGVVLWMWLAWELGKRWVWVLCALIALGIMASRLLLGVHDLEDVTIGAAIGLGTLLVFEQVRQRNWHWQVHPSSAGLMVLAVTALALSTWPGNAPDYVPMLAAWLIVATWALHVDDAYLDYAAPRAWRLQLLMAVLGTAAFLAEQKLLKAVLLAWPLAPAAAAALKGAASALFVSLLMPWVFLRLRLGRKAHPMPLLY